LPTVVARRTPPDPEEAAAARRANEVWASYPNDEPAITWFHGRIPNPGVRRAAIAPFLAHKVSG
jgi:hypothetical protein